MNAAWNWFVIILSVGNLLACWWLLMWTIKKRSGESAEGEVTGHRWDGDLEEYNNPLPRWWIHLFNVTIVFALVYLVLYPGLGNFKGYLGWTQISQYNAEAEVAGDSLAERMSGLADLTPGQLIANEDALLMGQRLYAANCSLCHGSDARGAPQFPNLRDEEWLYGSDFESIVTSIAQGRTGVMPPWLPVLGDDGLKETVAYVQQLSGQDHDPALAAAGQIRYQTLCVSCHGADGKGNPLLGAPDMTNDIWLYGGSAEALRETIGRGRTGAMPAHEDLLGEERIRLVAAYVASLSADDGGN